MNTEYLYTLLGQDRLEETLAELQAFAQQHVLPYHSEILQQAGRLSALQREVRVGAITPEERRQETNAIRYNLSQLIKQIDQHLHEASETILTDATVQAELQQLVEQYQKTKTETTTASRLRAKNELVRAIAEKFVQKPHLIEFYLDSEEEAILAGIARKINRYPCYQDLAVIDHLASRSNGHFIKGVITNALGEMIYSGQLSFGDDQRIADILQRLEQDTDEPLQKNIERVRAALAYFAGQLPNAMPQLQFHDPLVAEQYQRLVQYREENKCSPARFIRVLSKLFDRGTYRFEPCIKECIAQAWQERWVGNHETRRLLGIYFDHLRPEFTPVQRRALEELQRALFKYQDTMGAFLFQTPVEQRKFDDYRAEEAFPAPIYFHSPAHPAAEPMPHAIVQAINTPLQRAIELVDTLLQSVGEEGPVWERCQGCICVE